MKILEKKNAKNDVEQVRRKEDTQMFLEECLNAPPTFKSPP